MDDDGGAKIKSTFYILVSMWTCNICTEQDVKSVNIPFDQHYPSRCLYPCSLSRFTFLVLAVTAIQYAIPYFAGPARCECMRSVYYILYRISPKYPNDSSRVVREGGVIRSSNWALDGITHVVDENFRKTTPQEGVSLQVLEPEETTSSPASSGSCLVIPPCL